MLLKLDDQLHSVADESERTAEELMERAKKLMELGSALILKAAKLRQAADGVVPEVFEEALREVEPKEERSIGMKGQVTMRSAINAARDLQKFTRVGFAQQLGLKPITATRWINKLLAEDPPIVKRIEDEGRRAWYHYIPANNLPGPKEHPTLTPPERDRPAYEDAPVRGLPIRIKTERDDRRARSTPGSRQKVKNRDRAYERQEAAKRERAEKSRRKHLAQK